MSARLALVALALISGCQAGAAATLAPAEGFSLVVPPFAVPAGTEVQDCYFFAVPDLDGGRDLFIDRFVVRMPEGSHHTNVRRVGADAGLDGQAGEIVRGGSCWSGASVSAWPVVLNVQTTPKDGQLRQDWSLPPGVAERFSPGERLMIQTHFVNATTERAPMGGAVQIDLHRSTTAAPIELGSVFATNGNVRVCRSQGSSTFVATYGFSSAQPVHIVAATGHFHSRGVGLRIDAWGGGAVDESGPPLYEAHDFEEPHFSSGLDVLVVAGGGISWRCDYAWQPPPAPLDCAALDAGDPEAGGDCCYAHGPHVEQNEHCVATVYYWPKAGVGPVRGP